MSQSSKILLSFIIPTNNKTEVKRAINSIVSLDGWNSDCELIIVVNNCPKYFHDELLDEFFRFNTKNVRFIYLEKGNIAKARNKGIDMAKGEYVIHIDSDCEIKSDYLKNFKKYLSEQEILVDRGAIEFIPSKSFLSRANCEARTIVYAGRKNFTYTPNLIVKKSLYKKVGLFEEKLFYGEDVEWGHRLENFGISPVFLKDLVVRHFDPEGSSKIMRIYFRYGVDRTYRFKKYFITNKSIVKKIKNFWRLFAETPGLNRIKSIKNKLIILFLCLVRDIGVIYGLFKWTIIK